MRQGWAKSRHRKISSHNLLISKRSRKFKSKENNHYQKKGKTKNTKKSTMRKRRKVKSKKMKASRDLRRREDVLVLTRKPRSMKCRNLDRLWSLSKRFRRSSLSRMSMELSRSMRCSRSQRRRIALTSQSAGRTETQLSESSNEARIVAERTRAILTMKDSTTRECRG